MSDNNKRSRCVTQMVNDQQKQIKKKRIQGEPSSLRESSKGNQQDKVLKIEKPGKWDANAWYEWWTAAKNKVANKQALLQLAKDEKEYAPSKAYVRLDVDDSTDVAFYSDEESFDGLDYEDAYLAFDPEKSP